MIVFDFIILICFEIRFEIYILMSLLKLFESDLYLYLYLYLKIMNRNI